MDIKKNFAKKLGMPLPLKFRKQMEYCFNADFSEVLIYCTNIPSRYHAHAFTDGNHVYILPSYYRVDTVQGQFLLAHELAHIVQQRAGRVALAGGINTNPQLEREADLCALLAVLGFLAPYANCYWPSKRILDPVIQCGNDKDKPEKKKRRKKKSKSRQDKKKQKEKKRSKRSSEKSSKSSRKRRRYSSPDPYVSEKVKTSTDSEYKVDTEVLTQGSIPPSISYGKKKIEINSHFDEKDKVSGLEALVRIDSRIGIEIEKEKNNLPSTVDPVSDSSGEFYKCYQITNFQDLLKMHKKLTSLGIEKAERLYPCFLQIGTGQSRVNVPIGLGFQPAFDAVVYEPGTERPLNPFQKKKEGKKSKKVEKTERKSWQTFGIKGDEVSAMLASALSNDIDLTLEQGGQILALAILRVAKGDNIDVLFNQLESKEDKQQLRNYIGEFIALAFGVESSRDQLYYFNFLAGLDLMANGIQIGGQFPIFSVMFSSVRKIDEQYHHVSEINSEKTVKRFIHSSAFKITGDEKVINSKYKEWESKKKAKKKVSNVPPSEVIKLFEWDSSDIGDIYEFGVLSESDTTRRGGLMPGTSRDTGRGNYGQMKVSIRRDANKAKYKGNFQPEEYDKHRQEFLESKNRIKFMIETRAVNIAMHWMANKGLFNIEYKEKSAKEDFQNTVSLLVRNAFKLMLGQGTSKKSRDNFLDQFPMITENFTELLNGIMSGKLVKTHDSVSKLHSIDKKKINKLGQELHNHCQNSKCSLEYCEELLGQGAPIDGQHTKTGNTVLHYAVQNNNKALVKLLLDASASIDIVNNKDLTPLELALENKDIDKEIIKMLIDKQLKLLEKNDYGNKKIEKLNEIFTEDIDLTQAEIIDLLDESLGSLDDCRRGEVLSLTRGELSDFIPDTGQVDNDERFVIHPVNIQGGHWTCLVVDTEENKAFYFDSIGNYLHASPLVKLFVEKEYGNEIEFIHLLKDDRQQGYDNTCGTWVAEAAPLIINFAQSDLMLVEDGSDTDNELNIGNKGSDFLLDKLPSSEEILSIHETNVKYSRPQLFQKSEKSNQGKKRKAEKPLKNKDRVDKKRKLEGGKEEQLIKKQPSVLEIFIKENKGLPGKGEATKRRNEYRKWNAPRKKEPVSLKESSSKKPTLNLTKINHSSRSNESFMRIIEKEKSAIEAWKIWKEKYPFYFTNGFDSGQTNSLYPPLLHAVAYAYETGKIDRDDAMDAQESIIGHWESNSLANYEQYIKFHGQNWGLGEESNLSFK